MLEAGEGLARGEAMASCDGQAVLALSNDGALTLTSKGRQVWTAATDGAGAQAVLEDNGELLVVDADGETVFTTETGGFPDANVVLGAGGMKVTSDEGTTLWTPSAGSLINADDGIDDLGEDSQRAP